MREAMVRILSLTDLFLPSGDELMLLAEAKTEGEAFCELLGRGPRAIVQKRGSTGARYVDATLDLSVPAFAVEEVDPTGAGDCFGGTFTALWLRGTDPEEALTQAAAAGALAVTKRGPMEGASTADQLRAFIASRGRAER